jgi:CNT family concentrative nucleoside transporter
MLLAAQALLGIVLIPLVVLACSENRRALSATELLRWILTGLAVQYAVAVTLTQLPWTQSLFSALGLGVEALQASVDEGSKLVFGYLAGGPAPFAMTAPENSFVVAFRVFPMILVLSALIRLLYHWGVLQWVVRGCALALQRSMGLGGPLATSAAASVFLGLVEAPLVVKPYISGMSRGALFAMLVCTMATVAGTVMALYAAILGPSIPGAAGHLLAASLMNVPAALMLARIAVPTGFSDGPETADVAIENPPRSSLDAIAQGTSEGISIVAGVIAMLIVAVSLVTLLNAMLALIGTPLGVTMTLQRLLGLICAPFAFAIGIPWSEAPLAGSILGLKVVLNEFLAFLELAKVPSADLSDRSRLILTYALCGFANLGSLGITIGGLSAMAPDRRSDIVALAPRSVLVGALATMLSGAVMGTLTWR